MNICDIGKFLSLAKAIPVTTRMNNDGMTSIMMLAEAWFVWIGSRF